MESPSSKYLLDVDASRDGAFKPHQVNFRPLTPVSFLEWAATVYPDKTAVVEGDRRISYSEWFDRCCRLAGALHAAGVEERQVVAVMSPNSLAMLEAHYAIPMIGAIIAPINPRRDVSTLSWLLEHSEARMMIVDAESLSKAQEAVSILARPPMLVVAGQVKSKKKASGLPVEYEEFLTQGSANFRGRGPTDEWQSIGLNYTQGTEETPKGVLYHHRGAYLNAMANVVSSAMSRDTVYLWTLPIFRAHGWCNVWAVTAAGGTHVCLRDGMAAEQMIAMIEDQQITHMSGKRGFVATLARAIRGKKLSRTVSLDVVDSQCSSYDVKTLEDAGFRMSLLYGMTETYGPAAICNWQQEGSAISSQSSTILAHAAAHYPTLDKLELMHPETMAYLPADGKTVGEIVVRGNTVFKGYYKDAEATRHAFRGGVFHTGDLGVIHPDGHVEIISRCGRDAANDPAIEPEWLQQVEAELMSSGCFVRTAAIALPHAMGGKKERYALFIQPKAHMDEDWLEYAHTAMNDEQLEQVRIIVMDAMPITEDGDVMRYRLYEWLK